MSRENLIYSLKIVLTILCLFLNSCLSIKSSIEINRDNSGTISFDYKVDKTLIGISEKSSKTVPLNLDRDYIESLVNENSGIELISYSYSEDEGFGFYNVELSFSSIEDLNRVLPGDNQVLLVRNGDSTTLTQVIVAESREVDPESMELFRDIFNSHSVEITVKTPGDIISVNNGVRKSDNEAIYQNSIIDILENSDKIDWSISW